MYIKLAEGPGVARGKKMLKKKNRMFLALTAPEHP